MGIKAIKPLNMASGGSVGEAMVIKDEQGYDRFLSQALKENNTYRLFFPVVKLEEDNPYAVNGRSILGAAYGGRNCDKDAVKCSFLPLTNFEKDEFGQLKDSSDMGKYAKIASVLHEASYRYAIKQVEDEAKRLAEENDEPIDTVGVAEKKKKLDQEYHGAVVNNVPVAPICNPIIRGTSVFTFVSAVLVQLNPDNSPSIERSGIERITFTISKKKVEELNLCLKNLSAEQKGRDYIEVSYAYLGKSKNEAGQNAHFEYVTPESELRVKYKDWWKVRGSSIEKLLIHDVEKIAVKNKNIANPPDEFEVVLNFKKWIATNRVILNYIDFDAQNVKGAAKDLLDIDAVRSMTKARVKLEEIVKSQELDTIEEVVSDVKELNEEQLSKIDDIQKAASLADIVNAAGGMEAYGDMMENDSSSPAEL